MRGGRFSCSLPHPVLVSVAAKVSYPLPLRLLTWSPLRHRFDRLVYSYLPNGAGVKRLPCSRPQLVLVPARARTSVLSLYGYRSGSRSDSDLMGGLPTCQTLLEQGDRFSFLSFQCCFPLRAGIPILARCGYYFGSCAGTALIVG